jgi:DNA polymerase
MIVSVDIETKSGYDLPECGVYKYIEHPDFKILIASLDIDGVKVRVDFTKGPIPDWWVSIMTNPEIIKWAYNAQFERICISKQLGIKYISPKGWRCKMVHCYANGASGSLAGAEKLINGVVNKDPIGKKLIKMFSIPPYQEPIGDDWELFKEYCDKDVIAEMALDPSYNKFDTELYYIDQIINDRGIAVDLELVNKIIIAGKEIQGKALKRVQEMGLENPNSNLQKLKWFRAHGFEIPNVRKATITDIKHEMVELLGILGSATLKKYDRILKMVHEGRIKGMFLMDKQHCNRWSGKGVMLHNLARGYATETEILEAMKNIDSIEKAKNLVRGCFIGNFSVADFSGIEARVLAWICGFNDKLGIIRQGIDLYKKNATDLYNVPYGAVTKHQRKVGKTMELALGYQGWINAMLEFGAGDFMQESEIKTAIQVWRLHNAPIVNFWAHVEQYCHLSIQHKTKLRINEHLIVDFNGKDMLITLPSGHNLVYRNAGLIQGKRGSQISYQVNKHNQLETRYTWGGKLVENIVQGTAWALLRNSIINTHNAGFKIVAHVHDEIIVEDGDLEELIKVMTILPSWADGLPLEADGFTGNRYRKG